MNNEFIDVIKIPKTENVHLLDNLNKSSFISGTLYITSTHLIFINSNRRKEIWMLHLHISSIDKNSYSLGVALDIKCKNFCNVTFVFENDKLCDDIKSTLQNLSNPTNIEDLYAFSYKPALIPKEEVKWSYFDIQAEFMRMGVPNDYWSISHINNDYQICESYPRYICVPKSASNNVLMNSSLFRSRGRLPVLCYHNIKNQATLIRCAQPLSGFNGRCVEDEALLQLILQTNPSSKFMYLIDTRPKINAIANMAVGKGYESEQFYINIKFLFLPIENIHVMRSSLQKLLEICEQQNNTMSKFLNILESSGWLRHIKSIIDTAVFVSKAIVEGVSVVVHCSDGWDRTSQITSLSTLIIDPYYRTIEGFQILIEKDWLSFGHKFPERCGHLSNDSREISPIFTQFLDCVWQLMQQFPNSFEFNEEFLLTLNDHLFSCQYGNFLVSTEKECYELRLNERTYSFWKFISIQRRDFLNPFFKKENNVFKPVICPVVNPQSIKFWRGMYCRFEIGLHPRESIHHYITNLKNHSTLLDEYYDILIKRIGVFNEVLGNKIDDEALHSKLNCEAILDGNYLITDLMNKKSCTDLNSDTHNTTNKIDPKRDKIVKKLIFELSYITLDYQDVRSIETCKCFALLERQNFRIYCCHCGHAFCNRCIERSFKFPEFHDCVSVCNDCLKKLVKFLMTNNNITQS